MIGPRTEVLTDPRRLSRFVSVGIFGAGIDLAIGTSLLFTTTVSPEIAKIVGAECAILVMFVVNDRWTYNRHRTTELRQGLRRLLKSNLVRSGGIAVQVVVVFVLVRLAISVHAAGVDVWPVFAFGVAIACGGVINYIGETLLTWRVRV